MRHLLAVAGVALALGGCWPGAEAPIAPAFSGWWKPEKSNRSCSDFAFRIDKDAVRVRKSGFTVAAFDVENLSVAGTEAHMHLRVNQNIADLASFGARDQRIGDELPKLVLKVTLRVSGNTIYPGNVIFENQGAARVRAPRLRDVAALSEMFRLKRCV